MPRRGRKFTTGENIKHWVGNVVATPIRGLADVSELTANLLDSMSGSHIKTYNKYGDLDKSYTAKKHQLKNAEEPVWLGYEEKTPIWSKAITGIPMHLTNALRGAENLIVNRRYSHGSKGSRLTKRILKTGLEAGAIGALGGVLNTLAPESGYVMDVQYDPNDPSKVIKGVPADIASIKGVKLRDSQGNFLQDDKGNYVVRRPAGKVRKAPLSWLRGVTSLYNATYANPSLNIPYGIWTSIGNNFFHPDRGLLAASETAASYSDHVKDRFKTMARTASPEEFEELLNDKNKLASYLLRDAKSDWHWSPDKAMGVYSARKGVAKGLEDKLGEIMSTPEFEALRAKLISNKALGVLDTDIAQNIAEQFIDNKFANIDSELRKGIYDKINDSNIMRWSNAITTPYNRQLYIDEGLRRGHEWYKNNKD